MPRIPANCYLCHRDNEEPQVSPLSDLCSFRILTKAAASLRAARKTSKRILLSIKFHLKCAGGGDTESH